MAKRGRVRLNTSPLIAALMFVARRLVGRGLALMVAVHGARQLAGGGHH